MAAGDNITTLVSDGLGLSSANLGGYFNNLFQLALLVGAVLAVLIIASAGLQYMSTDAVSGKGESKTRITQALIGLLMLLSVWLFFNEINPRILDLDFELDGVSTTVTETEAQRQQREADARARAARNPILPGSTIGTRMRNPTWTVIPFNKYCKDVRGDGWVNIDAHHCTGTRPSIEYSCCGEDPDYTPPAEVKRYVPTGKDLGTFYDGREEQPPTGSWCYRFEGGRQCFTVKDDCVDERVSDSDATEVCKQQ